MNASVPRRTFHKILIANRGEIALRIMRTARRLGYGVVAVYSDADKDALHVREADQAVRIGGALPAQSYLNIAAVIAAAKAAGADAVHPGYGFLAENEDFAQACRDTGLVFIGPSPDSIRAMGNKAGAKEIMLAAGVPCVPGYQGADQSDAAMPAWCSSVPRRTASGRWATRPAPRKSCWQRAYPACPAIRAPTKAMPRCSPKPARSAFP